MRESNSIVKTKKRILCLIFAVTFLFGILFARLAYIQLYLGKDLQVKAAEQWYRDLPLSAPRGKILDTNSEVLADNKDVYTIYVRPNATRNKELVTSILSESLSLDYDDLYQKITKSKVSEITVKREVSVEVASKIRKLDLDGVYFSVDSKRNYPEGNFLTQILGFTNIDNEGQNGLEGYYNKYLKGVNGQSYTSTDIKGVEREDNVTKYVPPIPGCDVVLTVDKYIQKFAEDAVTSANLEFGSKSASMIVMDSKSGALLALANSPSFDLNEIPRSDIDLLNALSKNSMIVDVFEPGSTFKIFTTALALENKVVDDKNTFYCPGYNMVDGQRIRCWRSIGHGSVNLADGVKSSCNCVFMELALRLGTDRLYNGLEAFGFGKKTNVDFFGESRGILMNRSSVKNVDLARIGFGQAIAVTPLQLITAVCAAVNGGTLYEPYFVKEIKSYDGTTVFSKSPKKVRQVISSETSKKMREYLGRVVAEGGGKKAQVDGFLVGGKTGTAQKYQNGIIAQGKYVSSFVGFAPLDNPDYVVLMIVNEPSGYMYYGSLVAAPYAGRVFQKIFDYKGLKAEVPVDTSTVVMPQLEGKTLSECTLTLKKLGLFYELVGESGNVKNTIPIAGTVIPSGDIVLVRLTE